MKKSLYLISALLCLFSCTTTKVYNAADYGIVPNTGEDMSQKIASAISQIAAECDDKPARLKFEPGDYDFYPSGALVREYYISNHDQNNPKRVAVELKDLDNFVLDGGGARFVMNGRMLPLAMIDCENCTVENLAIDTRVPQIAQVEILENDAENGTITYRISPYVLYRIDNGNLVLYGDNWQLRPQAGIAFERDTKHIVYNTSDIGVGVSNVTEVSPGVIKAPWRNNKLIPGTVVVLRSYARPTPGIFLYNNDNTKLKNVNVHYAEGMGLLAQLCEDITLDGFKVALREGDGRYFTTQADATHFSACKGKITSVNGLYEGMMDDAINVHGTYLRVVERIDENTIVAQYMHHQAYGFYWGEDGDRVSLVKSNTMEVVGDNRILSIAPHDKNTIDGAKQYKISFEKPLPADVANGNYGIENLEWTPEVYFANNVVRNNRARGALFSTPEKVVVENNLFDHSSGTAILLCGDCNGWFETGACRNVIIRKNRFVNALTNMFQFTNAVISIYPEIPNLAEQKSYFHGGNGKGVVIEDNIFETFDAPLVYAKSLDGLIFRNNKVIQNNDYKPFHWNKHRFLFERVINYTIEDNDIEGGYDADRDLRVNN